MSAPKTLDDLGLSNDEKIHLRAFLQSWDGYPQPVLFAGAGLSAHNAEPKVGVPKSVKLKTWDELQVEFIKGIAAGEKSLPIDPLRLAELYRHQRSRAELLDLLEDAVPHKDFDPGPAHRAIVTLPWSAIVTTNYDDLIERAFEKSSTLPIRKIVYDVDLGCRRKMHEVLIVKMHGDFESRKSIVISEDDYRCYETTRPAVALKVRQLLLEHPVFS